MFLRCFVLILDMRVLWEETVGFHEDCGIARTTRITICRFEFHHANDSTELRCLAYAVVCVNKKIDHIPVNLTMTKYLTTK